MAEEQTILTAMNFLRETFYKYADVDDEKGIMSKKEFAELLRKHTNVRVNSHYTYFFNKMDEDGDSEITFKEFMHCLTDMYDW